MKAGYTVSNKFCYTDYNCIIVNNYPDHNLVSNVSLKTQYSKSFSDKFTIGVWKLKTK